MSCGLVGRGGGHARQGKRHERRWFSHGTRQKTWFREEASTAIGKSEGVDDGNDVWVPR
jgi:hypothetical protein